MIIIIYMMIMPIMMTMIITIMMMTMMTILEACQYMMEIVSLYDHDDDSHDHS